VAILDIAFASGIHFERVTVPFIDPLGARLALWCDHHEHVVGWAKYRGDPRFLLVPNREAHACPELITPEVVARAGPLDGLVVHGDFDGLLTAVKVLRKGQSPWSEADEDGRAVDSPGRGHCLTAHGRRIALALDEVVATFPAAARRDFLTNLLWSLAEGSEPTSLPSEIDSLARSAERAQQEATELARDKGREELPGVFVVRLEGRRRGRARKGILRYAEEQAKVGVVIETERSHTWVTAATFDERVDLASIVLLEGGRSDYRYCELKGTADAVLVALRRAVENRG
jgi:hypothetical protein